jgi:hypothetical protein
MRFPSVASFYAKRLILVEQMEKNGLNKEIRYSRKIPGSLIDQPLINVLPRAERESQSRTIGHAREKCRHFKRRRASTKR